MLRKILAVITGLVSAVLVFMIMQAIGGAIYGRPQMPEEGGMPDPSLIAAYMQSLPVGAFVLLVLGYMIGSFFGGFVARKSRGQIRSQYRSSSELCLPWPG